MAPGKCPLCGLFLILFVLQHAGFSAAQTPPTTAAQSIWTPSEWAKARQLSPLPPPPLDPSNKLSGNLRAARLGHRLFFDTRLSPRGISCATCHQPERGFTGGLPIETNTKPLTRNTMTILNTAYYRWFTWDGARDSLWHQASGPIENAREMGSSRLYVVRTVMRHYGAELDQVSPLPPGWQSLWPSLPAAGQPGDTAFETLPATHRNAVNQVFVTILKCIAAYERQLVSSASPFDNFVSGDHRALYQSEQRGFQHFLRLQCDTCHHTPLFSDNKFHNLGLPTRPVTDLGRAEGIRRLQQSPLRIIAPEKPNHEAQLIGQFRTPSLRELKFTEPYGHNGSIGSLIDWMRHYERVLSLPPARYVGQLAPELKPVNLSRRQRQELAAFLLALSSNYHSEWTQPPDLQ